MSDDTPNQQNEATEKPIINMLFDRDKLFIWVTAGMAFGILVAAVVLRGATHGKWQITLTDATIAAIVAGLSLIVSGKIRKLVVGKEGLTIETAEQAIVSSAAQPIKNQVSSLPVGQIEYAMKEGIESIPRLIQRRIQGFSVTLGLGHHYEGRALREYLEKLTQYEFCRYIIFLNQDGSLFGMVDARILLAEFGGVEQMDPFEDFANQLNKGDDDARLKLSKLEGFVSVSAAVDDKTNKRIVLDRMEKSGLDWFPVVNEVNEKRMLAGIVNRSKLVASMILDIANRLEASK
jgi:hypothetical protein